MDIIHDAQSHLTAEDILKYVQARVPGVNKSTVYRTLDLLEATGCVLKGGIGGRFIYHHAEEGHHHHLVCRACGSSTECTDDLFLPIETVIDEKYGFRADLKHVVVNGLCQDCKGKVR